LIPAWFFLSQFLLVSDAYSNRQGWRKENSDERNVVKTSFLDWLHWFGEKKKVIANRSLVYFSYRQQILLKRQNNEKGILLGKYKPKKLGFCAECKSIKNPVKVNSFKLSI